MPHHDGEAECGVNPYLAFTDVCINLVMILALIAPLMILLGNRGWDDIRYKQQLTHFGILVAAMPADARPELGFQNDAPGEQRWQFSNYTLFGGRTRGVTRRGEVALSQFARILHSNHASWWRIRIEAHTRAGVDSNLGSMMFTASRAVAISNYLHQDCGIDPWRITASGRGYQNPLLGLSRYDRRNDRIDILVVPPAVVDNAAHQGEATCEYCRQHGPPKPW